MTKNERERERGREKREKEKLDYARDMDSILSEKERKREISRETVREI